MNKFVISIALNILLVISSNAYANGLVPMFDKYDCVSFVYNINHILKMINRDTYLSSPSYDKQLSEKDPFGFKVFTAHTPSGINVNIRTWQSSVYGVSVVFPLYINKPSTDAMNVLSAIFCEIGITKSEMDELHRNHKSLDKYTSVSKIHLKKINKNLKEMITKKKVCVFGDSRHIIKPS